MTCGRASVTPGYDPCVRKPHTAGPCAHHLKSSLCRLFVDALRECLGLRPLRLQGGK